MDGLSLERVNPVVLSGFIRETHEDSPALARKLQEAVLENAKLKEHFAYLLCAAPLEPWGIKKLIELACDEELEASTFANISYGRVHEAICDEDLAKLIEAIAKLPNGIAAVLQILEMRFFIEKDSDYHPSEQILSAGRRVIEILATMEKDEIRQVKSHGFDRVCNYCLGGDAPISAVSEIAKLVFDGIENFRLYSFELGDLISPLVKNFPELVLDCVFVGGDSEELRTHMVFPDRSYGGREPSLNDAAIDRLITWCGDDQEKLSKLAKLVCPYTTLEGGGRPLENPSRVKLSDHMMAILDAVEDKPEVVETIFTRTWPGSWSGSLADILEVRGRALADLSDYPSPDVKKLVTEKVKEIEQAVLKNRVREADENIRREQRFE